MRAGPLPRTGILTGMPRRRALLPPLLLLSFLSAAQAGRVFTDAFRIPGALRDTMNAQQLAGVGLMIRRAQAELSGVTPSQSSAWPCVPEDTVAAFMTPNTLATYTRMKAAIAQQGWHLTKEVKSPDFSQFSVQYSRNGQTIMGMWAMGAVGPRATVVLCQQVKDWKPAAATPRTQARNMNAPTLKLPFTVQLSGWIGGTRSVRSTGTTADGDAALLARGSVTASGVMRLDLPGRPNAALLRPASEWSAAFGLEGSLCDSMDAPVGRVTVSDPQVQLAVLDDITVLTPLLPAGASAAQVLAAPVEPDHLIWSGELLDSGTRKVRLVYSSGPVTLEGTVACADGSGRALVSLRLPGGWTALQDMQQMDARLLLPAKPGEELRDWHDSNL
ncbi:hypothetical protein GCM10008939_01090 [Deinococcus aquiradiocola]|uniref:SCP domain-containing protein n=2 Tax=Deinococcus aquiradiocola TaxID=393059 RepID=A0A917P4D0_9DEIO|nr:hypothetical protein GCM10008939_01090 [Deinococcus aquiradiocola]